MEIIGGFKMNLREYLTSLAGGQFLEYWNPAEDEYIKWRSPSSCPMVYLWHDQDELLKLVEMDEDDPAKQEFIKRRNHLTFIWSFADWNLRWPSKDGGKTPGDPIPVPTIDNDKVFSIMPLEMRGLLMILFNHLWFNIDPVAAVEEMQGDPQGGENPESDIEDNAPATLRPREGDDPKSSRRSKKVSAT